MPDVSGEPTARQQAPAWSEGLQVANNLSVQTYGIPGWAKVIHVIGGSLMAFVGIRIALHPGNTGHPGTAPGYIAFGIIITALCIFTVTGQLTSCLVVTADGLSWSVWLRTRSVAWTDHPGRAIRARQRRLVQPRYQS